MENPAPEEQQQQGPEQAEVQAQQRDRVGLYFLQRLQALTSLRLVMPSFTGFESGVSSCTQLRCLHLGAGLFPGVNPGRQPCLSPAQYEVLSALSCLTELLCGAVKKSDMSVFYGAIKDLRHLETLALGFGTKWTLDALPVLAGLPRLSTVTGAWHKIDPSPGSSGSGTVATFRCRSVRWLLEAAGAVPFSAFPHLEECALGGSITPSALASMAQHCQHLTAFGDVGDTWELSKLPTTLPRAAPVAECVAAIQSLGQLSSTLKRITWHALVDAELAALATATSSCQALDKVLLVVPRGGDVSAFGLTTHLARLWRPKALSLELPGMYLNHNAAVALLSGLHPKMKLSLLVGSGEVLDTLYDAANEVESVGLAHPQLRLSVCEMAGCETPRQPWGNHMVPPPGAPLEPPIGMPWAPPWC